MAYCFYHTLSGIPPSLNSIIGNVAKRDLQIPRFGYVFVHARNAHITHERLQAKFLQIPLGTVYHEFLEEIMIRRLNSMEDAAYMQESNSVEIVSHPFCIFYFKKKLDKPYSVTHEDVKFYLRRCNDVIEIKSQAERKLFTIHPNIANGLDGITGQVLDTEAQHIEIMVIASSAWFPENSWSFFKTYCPWITDEIDQLHIPICYESYRHRAIFHSECMFLHITYAMALKDGKLIPNDGLPLDAIDIYQYNSKWPTKILMRTQWYPGMRMRTLLPKMLQIILDQAMFTISQIPNDTYYTGKIDSYKDMIVQDILRFDFNKNPDEIYSVDCSLPVTDVMKNSILEELMRLKTDLASNIKVRTYKNIGIDG